MTDSEIEIVLDLSPLVKAFGLICLGLGLWAIIIALGVLAWRTL